MYTGRWSRCLESNREDSSNCTLRPNNTHTVQRLSFCVPFKCSGEIHRLNTHNSTRSNILQFISTIAGVGFDCSTCRLVWKGSIVRLVQMMHSRHVQKLENPFSCYGKCHQLKNPEFHVKTSHGLVTSKVSEIQLCGNKRLKHLHRETTLQMCLAYYNASIDSFVCCPMEFCVAVTLW